MRLLPVPPVKPWAASSGVGLHARVPPFGRGGADAIVGIPALWADIDVEDAAHQKKNLPPTVEAAMEVLDQLPWRPLVMVHSGHGLQAGWRLAEVFAVEGEADRVAITRLVQRLQACIRDLFLKRGWTLDATHDVSRVMRVPGTLNVKSEPWVPTRILWLEGRLEYHPSDFDDLPGLEMDEGVHVSSAVAVMLGDLILNPKAQPPADKFSVLLTNDPAFDATWARQRHDFPSGAESSSEYDLSLATAAALVNWTPQEIVDLVIAHRRTHGQDLKLRADYYQSLLQKALAMVARKRKRDAINAALDAELARATGPEEDDGRPPSLEAREAVWDFLTKHWGIKVMRVVHTLGDPDAWRLEVVKDGETVRVELGDAVGILEQKPFRGAMANKAQKFIYPEKAPHWDRVANRMITYAEVEDLGEETRCKAHRSLRPIERPLFMKGDVQAKNWASKRAGATMIQVQGLRRRDVPAVRRP